MEWLQPMNLIMIVAMTTASAIGGAFVCLRKVWSEEALYAMISAGGGLLLSITILDLLPRSLNQPGHSYVPFVLLGFCSLFVIEQLGSGEGKPNVWGTYLGFITHAFLEGLSLMASFQVNIKLGLTLVAALLLHKIPDGITVSSLLLASTKSRMIAFLGAAALGGATLLGMFSLLIGGHWLAQDMTQIVMASTTGVFLYVSASQLVPLIQQKKQPQFSLYFFAAALAYLFATLLLHNKVHLHA